MQKAVFMQNKRFRFPLAAVVTALCAMGFILHTLVFLVARVLIGRKYGVEFSFKYAFGFFLLIGLFALPLAIALVPRKNGAFLSVTSGLFSLVMIAACLFLGADTSRELYLLRFYETTNAINYIGVLSNWLGFLSAAFGSVLLSVLIIMLAAGKNKASNIWWVAIPFSAISVITHFIRAITCLYFTVLRLFGPSFDFAPAKASVLYNFFSVGSETVCVLLLAAVIIGLSLRIKRAKVAETC